MRAHTHKRVELSSIIESCRRKLTFLENLKDPTMAEEGGQPGWQRRAAGRDGGGARAVLRWLGGDGGHVVVGL